MTGQTDWTTWQALLTDYFNKRWGPGEAQRWLDEIRKQIPGDITEHEICEAIRDHGRSDVQHTPTLKVLVFWIRQRRRPALPEAAKDYRRQIDKAKKHADIFEIICGVKDWRLAARLEQYAAAKRGYDKKKVPVEFRRLNLAKGLAELQTKGIPNA